MLIVDALSEAQIVFPELVYKRVKEEVTEITQIGVGRFIESVQRVLGVDAPNN